MSITPAQLQVLTALRAAEALRREPKTLTPDGHEKWRTLEELEEEGRLVVTPRASAAARTLRKQGLVAGRTQFTVTRYSLTGGGGALLARLEKEAGASDLAAAEMALEQAEKDERDATARCQAARAACSRLRREAGVRGSANVLLDYLKENPR